MSRALEDQLKNSQAELAAATEGRQKVKGKYNVLCNALVTAVETMLREMPTFMTAYGLTAPDLSTDRLDMNQFFDWLRTCLAMLDARSKLYGDLSAVVTARTSAASVCNFLPTEADSPQTISKTQLHTLRSSSFGWPSEEAVRLENLPPLPKNIAKNFIESFFKD